MANLSFITKFSIGALCLAFSLPACADPVVLTLDGNFAAPDYAFYSYTDTEGATTDNVPISPYITTLNGGGYSNESVLAICFDYASDTPVGSALSGTVEPLSYFTGDAYNEVMESTYLINELVEDGGLNAPLATRGALSFAIWELMNPSSTNSLASFPSDPDSLTYEAQAAAAVTSGAWTVADANQYPTWVPDDSAYQRFGIIDLAPEPSTLVLTGLGFLGLAVAGGRRWVLARAELRR
jgi:hypothetical protein